MIVFTQQRGDRRPNVFGSPTRPSAVSDAIRALTSALSRTTPPPKSVAIAPGANLLRALDTVPLPSHRSSRLGRRRKVRSGQCRSRKQVEHFDPSRTVRFTEHADDQGIERAISRADALHVLKNPIKIELAERGCHNVWGHTAGERAYG